MRPSGAVVAQSGHPKCQKKMGKELRIEENEYNTANRNTACQELGNLLL
jgi:hypothetical protein